MTHETSTINNTTENAVENVIIIGSGPAGYTAALYTARANLNPLLIAGSLDPKNSRIKGGQLMFTSDIENFPGAITVPDTDMSTLDHLYGEAEDVAIANLHGVSGPNLMKRMEMQARHFGARMIEEFVTEINVCDAPGEYYVLKTQSGKEYRTHALIIATGAAAKTLGISAEEKYFGQGGGVSTCATCDGHSYRGKVVAVVGGGDSAMEEASYLARLVDKVYLIHRREEFRASKIMLKRAQDDPKIEFLLHKKIADIKGKPHPNAATMAFFKDKEVVSAAVLEDTQTGEISEVELDGIFVAIGHTPNTDLFKNQLCMDEAGYLIHDKHLRALPSPTCSSAKMRNLEHVPGVFVAGDVADHVYRQAITAAGMGCSAAIEAERYLAEKLAAETGVSPEAVDTSMQSIAQSHWSSEREEMGEKPIIERVGEVAECVANAAQNGAASTA
jgi:thioredoxin reductase (NADPH)